MRFNPYIAPIAIFYGVFMIVVALVLFFTAPSREAAEATFLAMTSALAYISFGALLRVTKDKKVQVIALGTLFAIALLNFIEPNVMSGKFVINFVPLAFMILIFPDLYRFWKTMRKK